MFTRRLSDGLSADSQPFLSGLEKSAVPSRWSFIPVGGDDACPPAVRRGTGLFERTHLPDKSTQARDAARVAGCMAKASWYLLLFFPAGCSEGRLLRRSRCVLEKIAVWSLCASYLIRAEDSPPCGRGCARDFIRRSIFYERMQFL